MSAQADTYSNMIGYFSGGVCNSQSEMNPGTPKTTFLCYSTVF